jgi:hypothetical protein
MPFSPGVSRRLQRDILIYGRGEQDDTGSRGEQSHAMLP